MSLLRFTLYFVAVMACAVTAFPHWMPAQPISGQSASALDNELVLTVARLRAAEQRKSVMARRAAGD